MEGVEERIENIWIPLAGMLFKHPVQIIFTTATMPPYMVDQYRALLGRSDFNIIRVSSDRPNVAFHLIPAYAEPFPARRNYNYEDVVHALIRVFTALIVRSSTPNDRILVFFPLTRTVQEFAEAHNYLWHNSTRSKIGLNATLAAWDARSSRVLVGTTSLAQGLDRGDVRIVIVANALYGHTTLTQMLGRAGRDGLPSDLLFIAPYGTNTQPPRASNNPSHAAQHHLNAATGCQRLLSMVSMDGPNLPSYSCLGSVAHPCGNCGPEGIQRVAVLAVREAEALYNRQLLVSAQPSRSSRPSSKDTLSTKSSRTASSSLSSITSFPTSSSRVHHKPGIENQDVAQLPNVSHTPLAYLLSLTNIIFQPRLKTLTEIRTGLEMQTVPAISSAQRGGQEKQRMAVSRGDSMLVRVSISSIALHASNRESSHTAQ